MKRAVLAIASVLALTFPAFCQRISPPARLLGVSFSRPAVKAEETVNLILVLNHPAGRGGTIIRLESGDRNALPLPKKVTVPDGQRVLEITVTPRKVARETQIAVKCRDTFRERRGEEGVTENKRTNVREVSLTISPH